MAISSNRAAHRGLRDLRSPASGRTRELHGRAPGLPVGVSQEADIDFPKGMDNAALFKWIGRLLPAEPRTIALGGHKLMGTLRSTLPADPKAK